MTDKRSTVETYGQAAVDAVVGLWNNGGDPWRLCAAMVGLRAGAHCFTNDRELVSEFDMLAEIMREKADGTV